MRALLIVNPHATATTPRGRDVLVRALASDLKVDIAETAHRGHAVALARQAVADGMELVVALGGDGTVNEVVNGLLAGGPGPGVPTLSVVPGGSANVFARALGLPRDPVEATGEILRCLREGRTRRIGLGLADERWFTFCAGVGFDAEVVREVEARRTDGRRSTPALFVRATTAHFLTGADRRHPPLTIKCADRPAIRAGLAVVSNTTPWTYLGDRPMVVSPEASFESGLDLFAISRLTTAATLAAVARALHPAAGPPRGRRVFREHDLTELTVSSRHPSAVQVDGEYIGERARVNILSVTDALRVVA